MPGSTVSVRYIVDDVGKAVAFHTAKSRLQGVGGSQILLDDPFGNPIELFEPAGKK